MFLLSYKPGNEKHIERNYINANRKLEMMKLESLICEVFKLYCFRLHKCGLANNRRG